MRQNSRILPQDPSLSPTFALSQTSNLNNASIPQSLRRNLFSSQLLRRPVTSQPNPSGDRMMDPFQGRPMASPVREAPQPQIYRSESSTHDSPSGSRHISESHDPLSRSVSPLKPQPTSVSSIIATDPITGRPAIPQLPTLPARLRISNDGKDDEEEEDFLDPAPYTSQYNQPDLQRHDSSLISTNSQRLHLHELIDMDPGRDYRDFERIERVLIEMQSQQRARARNTESQAETPSLSSVSARTRGKAKAAPSTLPDQKHRPDDAGGTIDAAEKEELLSLIMSSLNRKVQEMDAEAWIYGANSRHEYDFREELET